MITRVVVKISAGVEVCYPRICASKEEAGAIIRHGNRVVILCDGIRAAGWRRESTSAIVEVGRGIEICAVGVGATAVDAHTGDVVASRMAVGTKLSAIESKHPTTPY